MPRTLSARARARPADRPRSRCRSSRRQPVGRPVEKSATRGPARRGRRAGAGSCSAGLARRGGGDQGANLGGPVAKLGANLLPVAPRGGGSRRAGRVADLAGRTAAGKAPRAGFRARRTRADAPEAGYWTPALQSGPRDHRGQSSEAAAAIAEIDGEARRREQSAARTRRRSSWSSTTWDGSAS